jgi:hypothetical protein
MSLKCKPACPCCVSCKSILHIHAKYHAACPCRSTMLLVHAACPWCLSILLVHTACAFCLCMQHVHCPCCML